MATPNRDVRSSSMGGGILAGPDKPTIVHCKELKCAAARPRAPAPHKTRRADARQRTRHPARARTGCASSRPNGTPSPRSPPAHVPEPPPTTSQDHLLLQELIDGQVTSLKEVYLWVDINGCKIIEAMTRKVTWMAAYNEITAWAVEQDHFKIKMVGKKVRARQPQ